MSKILPHICQHFTYVFRYFTYSENYAQAVILICGNCEQNWKTHHWF